MTGSNSSLDFTDEEYKTIMVSLILENDKAFL